MKFKYSNVKKMCEDFPTEFNSGYILALFHNNIISLIQFNELRDIIENEEDKGEECYG